MEGLIGSRNRRSEPLPEVVAWRRTDATFGQPGSLVIGSLAMRSPKKGGRLFDPRYMCGAVRDPGRLTIVTAGLGASVIPIRFGAPPDLWLLTLGASLPRP